ncbi:unnamed protein product [Ectocarpus sp. 12 AP-2014]
MQSTLTAVVRIADHHCSVRYRTISGSPRGERAVYRPLVMLRKPFLASCVWCHLAIGGEQAAKNLPLLPRYLPFICHTRRIGFLRVRATERRYGYQEAIRSGLATWHNSCGCC